MVSVARSAALALAAIGSLVLAVGSGCSKFWGFQDGVLSDGGLGQPCDSYGNNGSEPTPCGAGLICVGGTGNNNNTPGTCAPSCSSDNQCGSGQRCLETCGGNTGGSGAPYGCGASSQPCSQPGNSCNGGPCECPCGQTCADDHQCRNSCSNGGTACPGGETCLSQKQGGGFACYGTDPAHDPDPPDGAIAVPPTACNADTDCPTRARCLEQQNCDQTGCHQSLVCVPEDQPCTNPCNNGNCACPSGTTCGDDGQCRNPCQFGSSPSGCPGGEVCIPPSGSLGCNSCPGACYGTSAAHDPDSPDGGDQGERWLVVTANGTYFVTDPGCANPRQLDARFGFDYVTALSPGGDVALGVLVSPPQGGGPISVFVPGDAGAQPAQATGNFPFWSIDGGAFYYLTPYSQGGCQPGAIGLVGQALGADAGATIGSFSITSSCGPAPTAFVPGLVVSESHALAATLSQSQGGPGGQQVVFASTRDASTPAAPGTSLQFVFGSSDTGFVALTNTSGGQNQLVHIGWDGSVTSLYQSVNFVGGAGSGAVPMCAPHRIGASGNFYCNNTSNPSSSGFFYQLNLDGRPQQVLACQVNGQAGSLVDVVEP